MGRNHTHDKTVCDLVHRLQKSNTRYNNIRSEHEYEFYYKGKLRNGECDVIAKYRGKNKKLYGIVAEIKSFHTVKGEGKAEQQLQRDNAYYCKKEGLDRVFRLYVTPNKLKWITTKLNYMPKK